jgi:uncharacterized protein
MDNQHSTSTPEHLFSNVNVTGARSKSFMANVFAYMFLALAISAAVAFIFASNVEELIIPILTNKLLFYGVVFSPLVFSLLMQFRYEKLSLSVLLVLFIVYSVLIGISLSFILLAYTSSSVFSCFAGAAIMFAIMAFLGYTTNKDLTSFGRLMYMGFIGVFVASLINFFMQNDTMSYIIGIVGVAVFTGLTAFYIQKIKNIGEGLDANGNTLEVQRKKLSIIGALTLYITFINLFISLLRVFGEKK